jgi:hypothetical protein
MTTLEKQWLWGSAILLAFLFALAMIVLVYFPEDPLQAPTIVTSQHAGANQSEPRLQQKFVSDVTGVIEGQPSSASKSSETYMVKVDDEPGVVRMWSVTTIKGVFRSGDRVHCSKNKQSVVIDATGYKSPESESIACDLVGN